MLVIIILLSNQVETCQTVVFHSTFCELGDHNIVGDRMLTVTENGMADIELYYPTSAVFNGMGKNCGVLGDARARNWVLQVNTDGLSINIHTFDVIIYEKNMVHYKLYDNNNAAVGVRMFAGYYLRLG